MIKFLIISLLTFSSINCAFNDDYEEYMRKIKFTVFNNDTGESFESTFDESLSSQGCNVEGKFAVFTHGWMGSASRWIDQLSGSLGLHRGGCVIFMNYSHYGDIADYFRLVSRFDNISRVMTQKLNQLRDEGVSPQNIYMFGFSFGGRLVIESGIQFGESEISSIDGKKVSQLEAFWKFAYDFSLRYGWSRFRFCVQERPKGGSEKCSMHSHEFTGNSIETMSSRLADGLLRKITARWNAAAGNIL
jgi:hypothetical protein